MFQLYFKENFRCVKNVSISQFKITSCEKNATSISFICFIYLYNILRGQVALIEAVAAVKGWANVVLETCTHARMISGFRMSGASFDSLCDKLREQLQRNSRRR